MEILLKTDSRKVKPGDTFIAITNVVRDGHDYIEQAIANGATKIIAEHGSYSVETVIVKNTREYLNEYLYKNYVIRIKRKDGTTYFALAVCVSTTAGH